MKGIGVGFALATLVVMVVADDAAAQLLPGAGLGASQYELAGGVIDNELPVGEVRCDYSLLPNDLPRKATLEFDVTAGVTRYYYIGDVMNYTCGCTVQPTGCTFEPTETVLDIQADGTRTPSANQCAPRKVMKWKADGTPAAACPVVWRPIVAEPSEILDTKWDRVFSGSDANELLAGYWNEAIEANRDPRVIAADALCREDCGRIATFRQSAQSFGRCNGLEPQSYIFANGFCSMPNPSAVGNLSVNNAPGH